MTKAPPAGRPPLRIIHAWAPIRICDNGGWTDTWFARHGAVFNIAVSPGVSVQVSARPREAKVGTVLLHPVNLGAPYTVDLDRAGEGPHPLLELALAEVGLPPGVAADITIRSDVPVGCSTGTSAAVMVALVGALRALKDQPLDRMELARLAHRVEVERLGLQSGVQDQLAAAFGGISFIEIDEYPRARVTPLLVTDAVWRDLDERLVLVFLGRAHRSSEVHERVIASLADRDGTAPQLEVLRLAAVRSRDAVAKGDLAALGRAMIDNTEAQRALHPDLIGREAREVIALARNHGALGWKVNGAGGEGGSLTILTGPSSGARSALLAAIAATPPFRVIPTALSRGGLHLRDDAQP